MNNIYDNKDFFDQYAKMSRSQIGLSGAGEWLQFKDFFPNLRGKKVLDLGCGYGWHCKYALECGAEQVLGIDSSEKMINEATRINADSKITYTICNIEDFDYPKDTYDCVISNLTLHYISDMYTIYEKVYATLKNNGVFLLNIEHPIFTAGVNQDWIYDIENKPKYWPVDRYFYSGERVTQFLGKKIIKQHHTLTQILMGLIQNNFTLEIVEEAIPRKDMMNIPKMVDEMRRPMMLLIRAKKQSIL